MKISKILKRSISIIMVMAMLITLSSCGEKPQSAETITSLYKSEDFTFNEEISNINYIFSNDDKIYIIGSLDKSADGSDMNDPNFYENGGSVISTNSIYILNIDGTTDKVIELFKQDYTAKENQYIQNVNMDLDGNIVIISTKSSYTMEDYSDYTEQMVVDVYDKTGEKINSYPLSVGEDESLYSAVCGKDGKIYSQTESSIYCFNKDGDVDYKFDYANSSGDTWINNFIADKNGQVYANVSSNINNKYTTSMLPIDDAKKGFGDEIQLAEGVDKYATFARGNKDIDFIINDNGTLYSYDLTTNEYKELVNFIASGIDSDNISSYSMLSDGSFLISSNNWNNNQSSMTLSKLTPIDPSTVKDKKVINLYCWYLDYDFKKYIVDYNKQSEDNVIVVTDYSKYNDDTADDGYLAGSTKLNNDIVAGNIPDMLVITWNMPVNSYASKGLFIDLDDKLKSDKDIDYNDFIPNAIDAMKINGKLYTMTKDFTINALCAKTDYVGTNTGWSFDDVYKAMDNLNDDATVFNYAMTRDDFITQAVAYTGSEYIDWGTGECKFNSDSFIKLLEFANTLPGEINYDSPEYNDGEYWNKAETAFLDNRALTSFGGVYGYGNIREDEAKFGGPVTYLGFPCESKTSPTFSFNTPLAVMSKGTNQDGAIDFLKYYLKTEQDDEYNYSWGFSIKKSENEKLADETLNPDENSMYNNYNSSYYVGNQEIQLRDVTQDDIDKINNLIDTISGSQYYDDKVSTIISEETGAYFAGEKTAEQVAELINNRVSIYVNESR